MNKNIYQKSFVFKANRYEEYIDGACTSKGFCKSIIMAKVVSYDCVAMSIGNGMPVSMNTQFGLPIFGEQRGDVLEDRVMYGRLPDSLRWDDPNEPVVCELFENMECIRFAMMSPLRIVEFHGQYSKII